MTDTDPDFKGFNTEAELPSWMKKPPKSQRIPWTPPTSQHPAQHAAQSISRPIVQEARKSSKATAGIIIIATFVAWGFWFGFGLGLSLMVAPIESRYVSGFEVQTGEVWTFGRSLFCLVFSVALTWATWWVAMVIAED